MNIQNIPEFDVTYVSNKNWLLKSCNNLAPSVSVVIRPIFKKDMYISLDLITDIGSRTPDYTTDIQRNKSMYFTLKDCLPIDITQEPQEPPRLRRQIARIEMEPECLLRRDPEARTRNYLDTLKESFDNLTSFLKSCYTSNVIVNITLTFLKTNNNQVLSWTPLRNTSFHPDIYLKSYLFTAMNDISDIKDKVYNKEAFNYFIKYRKAIVISQSAKPRGYKGRWYHHHPVFPLSTSQISKDIRRSLPKIKDVIYILRTSPSYYHISKASDPIILDQSKDHNDIIIRKRYMYPTDSICVNISYYSRICLPKNIRLKSYVMINKKTVFKNIVYTSDIRRDIWLDTMIHFYTLLSKKLEDILQMDIIRKAYKASILHSSVSSTDLSFRGNNTDESVYNSILWGILDVKSVTKDKLADTARVLHI